MAIVNVQYDTSSKVMTTKIDGKEMPNMMEAHFYMMDDKAACSLMQMEEGEDGMMTYTHMCAHKKPHPDATPSPYEGMSWWATTHSQKLTQELSKSIAGYFDA